MSYLNPYLLLFLKTHYAIESIGYYLLDSYFLKSYIPITTATKVLVSNVSFPSYNKKIK